jgi:hypothetical protein
LIEIGFGEKIKVSLVKDRNLVSDTLEMFFLNRPQLHRQNKGGNLELRKLQNVG